jgi:hypothetical protein
MSIANLHAAERMSEAGLAVEGRWRHAANLCGLAILVLAVGAPLFYWGLFDRVVADHAAHVRFAQRGVAEGVWPAHFLFQALIYTLSGFQTDFVALAWTALVLLSACVVAKAWLSYGLLVRYCPELPLNSAERSTRRSHATLLALVAAALMLSGPVIRPWWTSRIYLGQISPNIWHNPTSLVCWPLAILLFFAAVEFLRTRQARLLTAVGVLAAVSVLAKPNYFLAFAPVYGLLAWRRLGVSRLGLLAIAALAPAVLLLGWQWLASFGGPHVMRPGQHIAWMPLAAWRVYSNWITVSLLFSLAFPLSYLIINWRSLRNRELLLFAWGVMLSALVWMGGFAEVHDADGVVDAEFNFSWGAHLSLFILFLVTAIDLFDQRAGTDGAVADRAREGRIPRALAQLPWWLLAAHAASGLVWITRQAIGRGLG